jgi:hypothetical protein
MQQINNENCAKFVCLKVRTFYTQISFIENTFESWVNGLIDKL